MSKQKIAIGGIIGILVVMGWILWPDGDQRIDISKPETGQAEVPSESALTEIDEPIPENSEKAVLPPAISLDDKEESSSEPITLGPDEGFLDILVIHKETGEPVSGVQISLDPMTDDSNKWYKLMKNEISSKTKCPEFETLVAYFNGELDTKLKNQIEKHLLDCNLCSATLESFFSID